MKLCYVLDAYAPGTHDIFVRYMNLHSGAYVLSL